MSTDPSKWRNDGDCYEAALRFILGLGGTAPPPESVLVHGRPTLQRPPFIKYGHAWIEVPQFCVAINVATGYEATIPIPTYYAAGQIDPAECFRYTPEQAREMALRFEIYGPWEGPEASEESA